MPRRLPRTAGRRDACRWAKEKEKRRKRGTGASLVFEPVLTISLRTNEQASDLSREIYSFIQEKGPFFFLSFDPSLLRRSLYMGSLTTLWEAHVLSQLALCFDIESSLSLSHIPTNPQRDWQRDLLSRCIYREILLLTVIYRNAWEKRRSYRAPLPLRYSAKETHRVNLIAAIYRGWGVEAISNQRNFTM